MRWSAALTGPPSTVPYRGTSLIISRPLPLGPPQDPRHRTYGRVLGGGCFLCARYPCSAVTELVTCRMRWSVALTPPPSAVAGDEGRITCCLSMRVGLVTCCESSDQGGAPRLRPPLAPMCFVNCRVSLTVDAGLITFFESSQWGGSPSAVAGLVQGYLAHKKTPIPLEPHSTLGMVLR
jgi:hypothetical protein